MIAKRIYEVSAPGHAPALISAKSAKVAVNLYATARGLFPEICRAIGTNREPVVINFGA